MSKEKIIKISLIVIVSILIVVLVSVGVRYFKYKEFIGEYKLVYGNGESSMIIDLYSWSRGSNYGSYKIKDNKLIFSINSGGNISYDYKITKSNNKMYLSLTVDNQTIKYKKKSS